MRTLQKLVILAGLVLGISLQQARAQITINFDTDANGNPINAPDLFSQTSPLTTLYAPLGVTFSGPNPGYGGAILNEGGNFGVNALSGENFLAFNSQFVEIGPETISFATPVSAVSIYASGGFTSGTFSMQAYSPDDSLVSSDSEMALPGEYTQLNVSSPDGITSVVLGTNAGLAAWVYDNLAATPVPEPGAAPLLLLGGAVLGLAFRYRGVQRVK